jgi:hypothetical protein
MKKNNNTNYPYEVGMGQLGSEVIRRTDLGMTRNLSLYEYTYVWLTLQQIPFSVLVSTNKMFVLK